MRSYFDNAASTPMFPEVIDLMTHTMREFYGNPSSIHAHGRKAKAAIEEARKSMAYHLGCSVGELFFTSGGTEANNTAIKSAVLDLKIDRIVTTPIEHPCVLKSIEHVQKHRNVRVDFLPVDQQGRISPDDLRKKLAATNVRTLVSIMHANNEIGTINDIEAIGQVCDDFETIFHSDTVQTLGHFPLNFSKLAIDVASGSAHKFHGPKGIGLLYLKNPGIEPLIDGGSQERNIRAGTENVASILGMAKALDLYSTNFATYEQKIRSIRDYAKESISAMFPGVIINGDPEGASLYTVLSVTFPPSAQSELLILSLDIEGISASGGSACSSGVQKISHVLAALSPNETGITVRFSFSPFNEKQEVDNLMEKLNKILKK